MATVRVRVLSALSGEELLPETLFECLELCQNVRMALGARPSRSVALFHEGALVADDFQVAASERVQFSAAIGDVLSVEEREQLLQTLRDLMYRYQVTYAFEHFSDAARDDRAVFLAAVQRHSYCLRFASEFCQKDKEIVLVAMRESGSIHLPSRSIF